MKILLLTAAACFALSACTTTSIDTAIQRNLPKTCELIETAHVAFSAVAVTGKISARTVARERAAYDGIAILCTDPGKATAADAIVRVAHAYVAISTALKEAKAAD